MKRRKKEEAFLEQIRMIPNVSLACEKVGLSRNTVYRWCKEDPEFKAELDIALETGTESVNDLAESKLIAHINNGNIRSIEYWLDNHKKEYARPRPKSFWEEMFAKESPIVGITLSTADPEQVRKEQKVRREEFLASRPDPLKAFRVGLENIRKATEEKKDSDKDQDYPKPSPAPSPGKDH